MGKHGKRKQSYLIRVDQYTKDKLDKIKAGSPYIRLSYNDILIGLLWEHSKNK